MTERLSPEKEQRIRDTLHPDGYDLYTLDRSELVDAVRSLLAEVDRVRGQLGTTVVEHAVRFKSGDWKIRYDDPEIERIYPLEEWIEHNTRDGGIVGRRTVIVLQDWARVPEPHTTKPAAP
jgi:hypothetical protein